MTDLVDRLLFGVFTIEETIALRDEAASRIDKLEAGEIEFDRVIGGYASENAQFRDRIEKLEAALRNVTTTWDVWQKEKDSNSFTELFASMCEAKTLEGKDD